MYYKSTTALQHGPTALKRYGTTYKRRQNFIYILTALAPYRPSLFLSVGKFQTNLTSPPPNCRRLLWMAPIVHKGCWKLSRVPITSLAEGSWYKVAVELPKFRFRQTDNSVYYDHSKTSILYMGPKNNTTLYLLNAIMQLYDIHTYLLNYHLGPVLSAESLLDSW